MYHSCLTARQGPHQGISPQVQIELQNVHQISRNVQYKVKMHTPGNETCTYYTHLLTGSIVVISPIEHNHSISMGGGEVMPHPSLSQGICPDNCQSCWESQAESIHHHRVSPWFGVQHHPANRKKCLCVCVLWVGVVCMLKMSTCTLTIPAIVAQRQGSWNIFIPHSIDHCYLPCKLSE